jgi:hypothetical protein
MIADPCQHIRQPGARIDIVQFGCDDQRIYRCCPLAARVGKGLIVPRFRRPKSRLIIPFIH